MPRAPAVRASAVQDSYYFIETLRPGAVRARIPADVVRRIESEIRTGWIPIADDLHFLAAVQAEYGREGARRAFAGSITRHLDSPLFSALASGAVRVFGAQPSSMLSLFPRVFPSVFRDFGRMRFDITGPSSGRLVLEDLAPEVYDRGLYLMSWEGLSMGLCEVMKKRGDARSAADVASRTATLDVDWQE